MQFGRRKIRSSGRGSGSVEITLPVDFAVLEGVACGVELRDGLMPEVVLRPDIAALTEIFEAVWERLRLGFERVDDIGEFFEGDYVLGLFAERGMPGRPSLACADALIARRVINGRDVGDAGMAACGPEAFARMFEAMATVAGARLGLAPAMAAWLGNQVGYAATGAPLPNLDTFARGALAELSGEIDWCQGEPLSKERWRAAQPVLHRLYTSIAAWNDDETQLETAREHWYRARRLENRSRTVAP